MMARLLISLILFIAGLICFIISTRPALNKKEQKDLRELNDYIAKTYGGK